jgi:hypothetical protein
MHRCELRTRKLTPAANLLVTDGIVDGPMVCIQLNSA